MNYKDEVAPSDSMDAAANKILNAHQAGDVIIIVGTCTVDYAGRAWSYLDSGERTVIVKPSGALLVHGATAVEAQNWQPADASITVDVDEDGDLLVDAKRTSPKESLLVRFTDSVRSIHYEPPATTVKLEGSEEEMHQHIFDNPTVIEDGFEPLEHEKNVGVGKIDVYGEDVDGRPVIIEVKRRKAQPKHVDQLNRYVTAVTDDNPRGILVAPSITASADGMLGADGFEFVELHPEDIFSRRN